MSRRCCLALGILAVLHTGMAREAQFPRWFFEQGRVCKGKTVVGYTRSSYFADSSATYAIEDGYSVYARQKKLHISGGQAFWSTEIGTFWMGSNFVEQIDSAYIAIGRQQLVPLDTCQVGHLTCVLLGMPGCALSANDRVLYTVTQVEKPEWIEKPPQSPSFFYAVGASPLFYYEASCWRNAEEMAFRDLARSKRVHIMAMQKQDVQGQEIRDEQLEITLQDVDLISRYIEPLTRIHYVLLRMRK